MVSGNPNQGPHPLPSRRSRDAPDKFKGKYHKVKDFIRQYERLLDNCQITSDHEKCEGITNYCATEVCRLIESLDEYKANDWNALKMQILCLYDAEREESRYQKSDMERFIRKYSKKSLNNLEDWKQYLRKFTVIGQWLKTEEVIQTDDYNTYFWLGIPREMRDRVETQLLAGDTTKDISKPFTTSEIAKTVERLLHRYRFDRKRASKQHHSKRDSSTESDSQSDSESESDTSSSDSEESDYERKHKKGSHKGKKSTDHPTNKVKGSCPFGVHEKKKEEEKKPGKKGTVDSIDHLIDEMSKLSIHEPAYARAYFKALVLNPKITQVFEKPKKTNSIAGPNGYTKGIQETRQAITHSPTTYNQRSTILPNSRPPFTCFGCGSHQHTLRDCRVILDLVNRGELAYNGRGQIGLPGQDRGLFRENGENLVEAYQRISNHHNDRNRRTKSNLVMVDCCERIKRGSVHYVVPSISDREQTDEENERNVPKEYSEVTDDEEEEFDDNPKDQRSYAVERTAKENRTARTARKEVMDGVYIPPRQSVKRNEVKVTERLTEREDRNTLKPERQRDEKKRPKDENKEEQRGERKNNLPNDQKSPNPPTESTYRINEKESWRNAKSRAQDQSATTTGKVREESTYRENNPVPTTPRQAPLGARMTRSPTAYTRDVDMVDGTKGEAREMGDGSKRPNKAESKPKFEVRPANEKPQELARTNVRRTELSVQNSSRDVLNKLLSTPISLTAAEILGTSRELSTALADQIRVKNVTSANTVLHQTTCSNHGSLLRIPVRVGKFIYNAVVDSGSEVNLIRRKLWETDLKIPMDIGASMTLHDANGGTSTLKGLIPDLDLKIGGLTTSSNFWVTTNCPLDILLGRPWARQNYVSIDEREDGTYLRFSKVNGDRSMEILVVPQTGDTGDPSPNGQFASKRNGNMSRGTYLGFTAEPITLSPADMDCQPMTAVNATERLDNDAIFKRADTTQEKLEEPMPYTVKNTYLQVFQPEPNLIDYGKAPSTFNNDRLGPIASRIHGPIGNHLAESLVLNSAQFRTVLRSLENASNQYRITYIIPTKLPELGADKAEPLEVTFPTVRLPDDARKITSPVPYAVFTRSGNPTEPFLPHYTLYLERYHQSNNSFVTLPPLHDRFSHGGYDLPTLRLLAEVCGFQRQLTRIQAEERNEREFEHDERARKVPINTTLSPLSSPALSTTASFQRDAPWEYANTSTPPPSLLSSIYDTDSETEDDDEDDLSSDDEASIGSSIDSDYPPPHVNPSTYATIIGRHKPFNLPFTQNFDPNEFRTHSSHRFTQLALTDGYFDGISDHVLIPAPITTGFPPALEYNVDYHPPPFLGTFPDNYLEPVKFYANLLYTSMKKYLDDRSIIRGSHSISESLIKYPPCIYFSRTAAYELHVYRGDTNYRLQLPDLRQLRADAHNLMHAIHAVLTPQQSAECMRSDIEVYLLDNNQCGIAYMDRGSFFQQLAPSANPIFSVEETGFIRSAIGLLRFYGEQKLANTIDLILQLPLPDEDLVASLLSWDQLDDPLLQTKGLSSGTTASCYRIARHLKTKQDYFYHRYGDADTVPPPIVPRALAQRTDFLSN